MAPPPSSVAIRRASGPLTRTTLRNIVGDIELDRAAHRVKRGVRDVRLGPTEYRLLEFFMNHPDRVYSRAQVLDRVWGGNVYVEERTVDVHIRRLRKALTPFGYDSAIRTVRGAGYRFSPQQT